MAKASIEKDLATVSSGKPGSPQGGKPTTKKLSRTRRAEIAKIAAMIRWEKEG